MTRRETQPGAVVFEDGETRRLGFLAGDDEALLRREFLRQVVVLAEEVAVFRAGVLFSAHRFNDVIAIKDAD